MGAHCHARRQSGRDVAMRCRQRTRESYIQNIHSSSVRSGDEIAVMCEKSTMTSSYSPRNDLLDVNREDSLEPFVSQRILIVESENEAADALIRVVEGMGHTVENAADAKTALLHLQNFEPQLVLLGTYLSDMPGYELTAILRGAPQYGSRFRHVGLLFVADRHKLLKHRFIGAPDIPIAQYIFKPIVEDEVRDKVTREIAHCKL